MIYVVGQAFLSKDYLTFKQFKAEKKEGPLELLVCYKKKVFDPQPYSRHRALETLGISCDKSNKGISCYVNQGTFGMHLRMGAVSEEPMD